MLIGVPNCVWQYFPSNDGIHIWVVHQFRDGEVHRTLNMEGIEVFTVILCCEPNLMSVLSLIVTHRLVKNGKIVYY